MFESTDVFSEYTSSASARQASCAVRVRRDRARRAGRYSPAAGRIAFISHATWAPGTGTASADTLCARPRRWARASRAPSRRARDGDRRPPARFGSGLPWRRPDGVLLAPGADALIGASPAAYLDSFVAREASGAPAQSNVWIGTTSDNCSGWTIATAAAPGRAGDGVSVARSMLLDLISATCDQKRKLLCMEK